jgi:hypothetical protein
VVSFPACRWTADAYKTLTLPRTDPVLSEGTAQDRGRARPKARAPGLNFVAFSSFHNTLPDGPSQHTVMLKAVGSGC